MGIEMEFDVFLCHNSSDKEAVKKIGEQLRCQLSAILQVLTGGPMAR